MNRKEWIIYKQKKLEDSIKRCCGLPEEYEDPAEELAEQNFRDTIDREREDEEDSRLR